jgi:hypothetical protein
MMLRLALYETLNGIGSPIRWARDAKESLPLGWLLRGMTPSARACYRFRDRMGGLVHQIHEEMIQASRRRKIFEDPVDVAQDGSFHRACASRHRLVNSDQLDKRRRQLDEVMQADAENREPTEPLPYWMPSTPNGRAGLLSRMIQAREILNERLKKNAQRRKCRRLDEKHICVSLSDPEAAISRDKERVFGPLYNVQYLTDYRTRLVLGFEVAATATDVDTLNSMIEKVQRLVDGSIQRVVADASYATVLDLIACKALNIDLIAFVQENSRTEKNLQRRGTVSSNRHEFMWLEDEQTFQCPAGHKLHYEFKENSPRANGRKVVMRRFRCAPEHCMACQLAPHCVKDPSRGRTVKRLEGQELLDAQRERMKQPDAQELYRYRGSVVERTIADTKEHRDGRRLHGHGLTRTTAEIGLKVIAQNILTLHRLRKAAANRCDDTG